MKIYSKLSQVSIFTLLSIILSSGSCNETDHSLGFIPENGGHVECTYPLDAYSVIPQESWIREIAEQLSSNAYFDEQHYEDVTSSSIAFIERYGKDGWEDDKYYQFIVYQKKSEEIEDNFKSISLLFDCTGNKLIDNVSLSNLQYYKKRIKYSNSTAQQLYLDNI